VSLAASSAATRSSWSARSPRAHHDGAREGRGGLGEALPLVERASQERVRRLVARRELDERLERLDRLLEAQLSHLGERERREQLGVVGEVWPGRRELSRGRRVLVAARREQAIGARLGARERTQRAQPRERGEGLCVSPRGLVQARELGVHRGVVGPQLGRAHVVWHGLFSAAQAHPHRPEAHTSLERARLAGHGTLEGLERPLVTRELRAELTQEQPRGALAGGEAHRLFGRAHGLVQLALRATHARELGS
jgi:hypothetical protein